MRYCVDGMIIDLNRRLCSGEVGADLADVKMNDGTIQTAEKVTNVNNDIMDAPVLSAEQSVVGWIP